MAEINLSKYGITGTTEIVHNPSYELLFEEETKAGLEGFEKGQVSELGAVNVMTGVYTGRSPKDKFIVVDENSKDTVWWTSDEYKNDNHPASQEAWEAVKEIAKKELSNKKLYVVDAFCGANKDTRMAIRFIVEVAWQAHFVTNMFIKPTAEELENFEPDFVVYNASKAKTQLSSSVFQEQVKLHFLQTRSVSSSVMTNTAGMTTEYSTLKVDATLRLSTLTKNLNQISTTQSDVTLFLRT